MRVDQCSFVRVDGWVARRMLLLLMLWTALPPVVLGQTYYINFVFNNNNIGNGRDITTSKQVEFRKESESQSQGQSQSQSHGQSEEIKVISVKEENDATIEADSGPTGPENLGIEHADLSHVNPNTDEIIENGVESEIPAQTSTKKPAKKSTTRESTTRKSTTRKSTTMKSTTKEPSQNVILSPQPQTTPNWLKPTPHPPKFFDYPEATCKEDMKLHEVFGIDLARDRGLPARILCEFNNSWGGPWLLMHRMELPVRLHVRRWFFGYLTDDYKDMNINFLSLAHIINNMRLAMLIIGQNNDNQLVYNLYDDVVISSFNDLFMLRKAHLVEANTTDLLFISVGEVLESGPGRNRSCPLRVLGAWWGPKADQNLYYCVFPVERNIYRPGYMAIFIKPSPFAVNNTAFYATQITTRRPWATTVNATIMRKANNNQKEYEDLLLLRFGDNKAKVKAELRRRQAIYPDIEKERMDQEKNQMEFRALTNVDSAMATT